MGGSAFARPLAFPKRLPTNFAPTYLTWLTQTDPGFANLFRTFQSHQLRYYLLHWLWRSTSHAGQCHELVFLGRQDCKLNWTRYSLQDIIRCPQSGNSLKGSQRACATAWAWVRWTQSVCTAVQCQFYQWVAKARPEWHSEELLEDVESLFSCSFFWCANNEEAAGAATSLANTFPTCRCSQHSIDKVTGDTGGGCKQHPMTQLKA